MYHVFVLTAVRISPSIRRTHQTRCVHLSPAHILIFKVIAVDARGTRAIALGDITSLNHELVDDSMEWRFCVRQVIVLSSAQLAKAVSQLERI